MNKKIDLDYLVANFKKSAKRLEVLQEFHIEGDEWDYFQKFLNGEVFKPYPELNEWNKQIDEWTKQGKKIERVRVIANPLSNYLKYEIEEAYKLGTLMGQKVNFVSQSDFKKIVGKQKVGDFWIFDDKYVFEMHYDENHDYIGGQLVDGQKEREIYNKLHEVSKPLEYVLKQIRTQKTKIKF